MQDEDQSQCCIHMDQPQIYLSQVVGANSMDGTELITLEIANIDGTVTRHNYPISAALAMSDKIMAICLDAQMRGAMT
jgi:hypothetical protein